MAHFQLTVLQEDVDQGIKYLELILAAAKLGWNISNSMLYQHTKLKNEEESFAGHMINGLLTGIQNDDSCVFLKTDSRFLEIVSEYNN